MKSILQFFVRGFVSFNVFSFTSLLVFFGFDTSIGIALLSGMGGGTGSYLLLREGAKQKVIKQNKLTRKEYNYIKQNIKEASSKIKRLNKSIFGIRSIQAAKQIGKLQRITMRIYHIVKQEPKRFYQGERFFFYNLDSVVELSERYVFLSKHNSNDAKLIETEQTLDKLTHLLEEDLRIVLAKDIDELSVELDIANQSYDRNKKKFPEKRS